MHWLSKPKMASEPTQGRVFKVKIRLFWLLFSICLGGPLYPSLCGQTADCLRPRGGCLVNKSYTSCKLDYQSLTYNDSHPYIRETDDIWEPTDSVVLGLLSVVQS